MFHFLVLIAALTPIARSELQPGADEADASSLMQVGKIGHQLQLSAVQQYAAAGKVSSQQLTAAISAITDEMKEIKFQGAEAAVGMIVEELSRKTQMDNNTIDMLGNISAMLDEILALLAQERDVQQAELDRIAEEINICNTAGTAQDQIYEWDIDPGRTNHTLCRADQVGDYQNETYMCQLMTEEFESIVWPTCIPPPQTGIDDIWIWDDWFANWDQEVQVINTSYTAVRDGCLEAIATHQAQITACNQAQIIFEGDFCAWRIHRHAMCTTRQECYDREVAAHNALWATILPLSEQRVREAILIVHIKCLLNNLAQGIVDRSLCDLPSVLMQDATYNATYGNQYVTPPAIQDCELDEVAIHPGHGDWHTTEYANLSNYTPHLNVSGEECPTLPAPSPSM